MAKINDILTKFTAPAVRPAITRQTGKLCLAAGLAFLLAGSPLRAFAGFSGNFSLAGGASFDGGDMDLGAGIAVYNSNVYVVGMSSPAGSFLVKYSTGGVLLASTTFSGVFVRNLAINANGIYVAAQGSGTGFVTAKYNYNLVQSTVAVLPGDSSARDLALDSAGNVYVIGSNFGENLTLYDYKFVKYDSNLAQIGSPVLFNAGGRDEGRGIAVDNGFVYITGDSLIGGATFFVTAKFNSTSLTFVSSAAYANAFVDDSHPADGRLAVNPVTHEVYLAGRRDNSILTVRYSPNLAQLGSALFPSAYYAQGTDIALDNAGNVYTLGAHNTTGSLDYPVLLKYSPALVFQSSAASVQTYGYEPAAVALDTATGVSYVTGVYFATGDGFNTATWDMRTVLVPALADAAPAVQRVWIGGGANLASEAANWGNGLPLPGDGILIDAANIPNPDLTWDIGLAVPVSSVTIRGALPAGTFNATSPLMVSGGFSLDSPNTTVLFSAADAASVLYGPVLVENGIFSVGKSTLVAISSITVNGGTFDLGSSLFMGHVVNISTGGTLSLHVGDPIFSPEPPVLTSTGSGAELRFIVNGAVNISGGVFGRLWKQGLKFGPDVSFAELSNVVFQGPLLPGTTAIGFGGGVIDSTFTNVEFADGNIAVNVNAALLSAGSNIDMIGASGPKTGASFESDAGGFVQWTNNSPVLAWYGGTLYTGSGLNNPAGNDSMMYVYQIKYADADNDGPLAGYPKVHILKGGFEIAGSPFSMTGLGSGLYGEGRTYTYSTTLSTGTDYTYYFEAQDSNGAAASGDGTDPGSPLAGPVVEDSPVLVGYSTITHLSAGATARIIISSSVAPSETMAGKDAAGNVYTARYAYLNAQNMLILAKYDPSGTVLWTRLVPMGSAYIKSMAVDMSGNIYVLGGINNATEDVLIARFNNMGGERWLDIWDSGYGDVPGAISVSSNGSLYAAVSSEYLGGKRIVLLKYSALPGVKMWEDMVDYPWSEGAFDTPNSMALVETPLKPTAIYLAGTSSIGGSSEGLVLKYTDLVSGARYEWDKRYLSPNTRNQYATANGVSADKSGNIYVTGQDDRSDIGQGYNVWLTKYSPYGVLQWVTKMYPSGQYVDDNVSAITLDDFGNVYIAGTKRDRLNSGENYNFWLAKYGPSGNLLTDRSYNYGGGSDDKAFGLTAGAASVYLTGQFGEYSGLYIMPTSAGGGTTPVASLLAMEGPYTGSVALSWNYPLSLPDGSSFRIQMSTVSPPNWNPAQAQVVVSTAAAQWAMQDYIYGGLVTARDPGQNIIPSYKFKVWVSSVAGVYTGLPGTTSYAKTPYSYDDTRYYGGQDRLSSLSSVQIGSVTRNAIALAGDYLYQAFGNDSGDSVGLGFRKYNLNSHPEWTKFFTSTANAGAYYGVNSMIGDNAGNFYAVGGITPADDTANKNIWIGKLSAAGNLIWSVSEDIDGGYDELYDVALDTTGGLYVAGGFTNVSEDKGESAFIRKYNVSASTYAFAVWTSTSDTGHDKVYGVAVDTANARVYFTGALTNVSGNSDLWIAKATLDGNFEAPTVYDSGFGDDYGYDIAVNPSGVYVVGSRYDEVNAKQSVYAARYPLALGTPVWTMTSGPQGNSALYSIKMDAAGNVYGAGYEQSETQGKNAIYGKINSAGVVVWNRFFNDNNTNGDEVAYNLQVDTSGRVCSSLDTNGHPGFYVFPQPSFGLVAQQDYLPGSVRLRWMSALNVPASSSFYVQYSTFPDVSWSTAAAQVIFTNVEGAVMEGSYYERTVYGLDNGRDTQGASVAQDYYFRVWVSTAGGVFALVPGTPSAKAADAYLPENMSMFPGDTKLFTIGSNMPYASDAGSEQEFNGVVIGPLGNVYMLANTSWNGNDIFVLKKFTSAGIPVWTKSYTPGEHYSVKAGRMAADKDGNIYITGYESNPAGATGRDLFLMKYNAAGALAWKYTSSSGDDETGYGVAVDTMGYAYVAGGYAGDIYVARFYVANSTGPSGALWSAVDGGAGYDTAYGIAVDTAGSVYAVGATDQYGDSAVWVGRYDASTGGNHVSAGNPAQGEAGYDVLVDTATGSVYVAGEADNDIYFSHDAVIFKTSADLSDFGVMVSTYDSLSHMNDAAYALALDGAGGIYAAGMEERYDIGQNKNLWIRKYATDLSELWTQTFNSNSNSYCAPGTACGAGAMNSANDDLGSGVAADRTGVVYVGGRFGNSEGMYRYRQTNFLAYNPTLNVVVKKGSRNSAAVTAFPGVVVALIPFSQTGGIDASSIRTGVTNSSGVYATPAPAGRQYFIALSTQGYMPTIKDQQMDPYGNFFVQLNGDATKQFILYDRPAEDPAYPLNVTVTNAAANDYVMAEIFFMQTGEKVAYGISQIPAGKSSATFTVPNVSPAEASRYILGITIPNRNMMKSVPLAAAFPGISDYSVSMSTSDGAIAASGGFDASVSTTPASLDGVVRDRTYMSPLADARVVLYHRACGEGNNPQYDESETLTDVNGRFSFYNIPASTMPYQVEVRKAGYSRGGDGGCWWNGSAYVPQGISISTAMTANYREFSLDQATYTFKGIITYDDIPVPNADVMINGDYNWYSAASSSDVYKQNGGINTDARIRTGADGSFVFSSATLNGLLEGGLRLQVSFFGSWTDINQGYDRENNSDDIRIVISGRRSAADLDSVCTVGRIWVLKASNGDCITANDPDTPLTFNISPAAGEASGSLYGNVVFVTTYTISEQNPLTISTSAPVTVMAMQECNNGCMGGASIGFTSLSGTFNAKVATYSVTLSTGLSYYTKIVSSDWGQMSKFDSRADLSSTDTVRMDFIIGKSGGLKGSVKLPDGKNYKPDMGDMSGPGYNSARISVSGKNVDVEEDTNLDNNGEFEFPNIAPGTYDITLRPQGQGFVWAPVNLKDVAVTAGKTTEVKLQLSEGLVVQPQILGLPDISTPAWHYVIVPVESGTEMNQKKITEMFFSKGDSGIFAFDYSSGTKSWEKKYMLPGQYDFYLMLGSMYDPCGGGDCEESYDQFANFIGKVKGVAVQKFEANPSLGSYGQPIPVNVLGSIGQSSFEGTLTGNKIFTDSDIDRIFANMSELFPLIPAVMLYDSAGDLKGYTAALPTQADFGDFWSVLQSKDKAAFRDFFATHPGRFMIPGLPPGRYTAVFNNPNYPPVAKEVELPKDNYAFDFEDEKILAGSISGAVMVSGSSEPVSNAVVYLKHRTVEKFTKTGDNGAFAFTNLPSGIYRIEVLKDGFVKAGEKTSLSGSDGVTLNFHITPSESTITGKVYLSKFPAPLTKAGIKIVAYDETLNVDSPSAYLPKMEANTNASGEYELTGIIPGHLYKVSAFYSGKLPETQDILAVEGDTYMNDIVLRDVPPQIVVKVRKSPDSASKVDVIIKSPKQLVTTPVCKFNPGVSYVSTAAVSLALVPGPNNTYLGQFTVSKNQLYYTVYFSAGDNNKMEKTILYDQTNQAKTEQYIQEESIQGGEVQMDKETEEYSGLELDPGALSYSTASADASFSNLVGGFFSALPSVRTVKTAKGDLTIESAIQDLMASEVYNMDLSNASANKPFTLTLKYDKDKGAGDKTLKIYQYDEAAGSWKQVPGNYTVDPMLGVVSVDVASLDNAYEGADSANTPLGRKRFRMSAVRNGRYVPLATTSSQGGKFAVFTAIPPTGVAAFSSAFEVYNMPNPFNLKTKSVALSSDIGSSGIANPYPTAGTLIKYNLPSGRSGNLKFVIYNIAGEKVRTINEGYRAANQVYYSEWDGKNDNNSSCASGVYFMLAYLEGKQLGDKAHKMAIIK